mgnify:CR=1 FL=1
MSTNSLKELVDAIKAQGKTLAGATGASAATSRDLVYLSTAAERLFGADAMLSMINEATKPAEVVSVGLATATTVTLTDEQVARTVVKITNSDSSNAQSGFVVVAPSKGVAFVISNALPIPVTVKAANQTANIPSIAANSTGWVFCDGTTYSHVIDTAAIAQAVTTPMTTAGDMMYKEGVTTAATVQHTVHVRNYGTESYYYIKPQAHDAGGFHSGFDKSPTLPMQPGVTYIFDVSDASNAGHIFSFSTTADGTHASGADLASFDATSTVHVTRSGTEGASGATVTVAMPATPNVATLHYYSRGTDSATFDTIGLGGQINVLTSTAVTRLPIGDYGNTLGIDKYTGQPIWNDWGANENRKVASLSRDNTGLWSGGRYKFANHITGSVGAASASTYIYASDCGTYDQTPTGWSTYDYNSAIVWNRGKLEGTTWGHQTEGCNGKSQNGDSIWEVNGYAKNGVGQGGFGKDDNEVFSDVIQTVSLFTITMQLLANGELYITGHGDQGQQADGANTDRAYFHKVNFPSNAGRVRYIVSNSSTNGDVAVSCMVLMEDGDLYSWGYGVNGALGLGNVTNYNTVQKVSYFDKNVKSCHMSGGDYSSVVAITNDNKLHTWGYNGYGQLGKGNTTTIYNGPAEIEVSGQIPVKALMTGSGSYGTLCVLMRSGRVYMCGHNNTGQLGNGNTTNQTTLTQVGGGLGVDTNKHVIDIFPRGTYGNNTWFLLEDGSMYACGQNALGIHGRGSTTANRSTPEAVSSNLTWVSEIIAPHGENGGYFQSMFIVHKTKADRIARKNGWVYMTGHPVLSIGFWNFPSPVSTPTPPQLPNGVNGTIIMGSVSGYTGHSTGYSAAFEVLDQYGDMYQWGYDASQKVGGEGNRNIPIKRIQ